MEPVCTGSFLFYDLYALVSAIITPVSVSPVILAFETVMVEFPSAKIAPVPAFETAVIVFIVIPVAIVAMPGRISIISITRIVPLKINRHMNLRFSGSSNKATGDDHHYN